MLSTKKIGDVILKEIDELSAENKKELLRYIESLKALEDFPEGVGIINLDGEVCNIFGRERNKLRKTGRIIGDFDLLIASICLRHKLILLTNNKAHFERIDNLEIVTISG